MTSPYSITPDHAYHLGSCCIFADLLRDGLWDIREKYITVKDLPRELLRCINNPNKYVPCLKSFRKLYDVSTSGRDIENDDCDTSVMYSILRHICTSLKDPRQGWGGTQKPPASDIEIADDIERIRIGRNTFMGHVNKASMSKDDFDKIVVEIRAIVRRIDMFLNSNKFMAGLDQIEVDCKDLSKMMDYKKFNDMLEEQLTYERENQVEIAQVKKETNEYKQTLERHEVNIAEGKKESNETKQELAKLNKVITSVNRKLEERQWKAEEEMEERGMGAVEEAGAAELKAHILKGYKKDFDTVLETSYDDGVSAIYMFSPIIIREDLENQLSDNSPVRQGTSPAAAASPISHYSGKVEQIQSYRDIFFKDGQLQRNIVLLGEAGVGKTTFCNHIVNLWCLVQTDDCQRDVTDNDQALIGVLKQFEYLFVVRCRDTKEYISVLSMIKEMFCSGEYKLHIDTIFHCKTKQCLVIIDGLDEWLYTSSDGQDKKCLHDFPDCTNICGATVIMTSRPWKVEALPRNSLRDYRVLQLEGLDWKSMYTLTQKCIEALEPSVTDHKTLCEKFVTQVEQQEMVDIVKQPLLLFSIIESWLSRNQTLHRSLTMNYTGLINSVLFHSDDKLSEKDERLAERQEKESLPGCFTEEMKTCLTHSGIIRKISALAFKTLVLKEKGMSLVFNKKELTDDVGEDCLGLCLKLGILSETKASSLARGKHVTISFIHKSVQECFAAVHLSEDKAGLCLTQFTNKLTSLNEVFDLALILIFLFGMSPSKGQTVLNHVYGVVDQCSEIKAYRQCADCDIFGLAPDPVKVCRLLNQLYVRCAVELNNTSLSPTSQHTSSQPNLYVPDILIDERTPDDVVYLLFCPGEHVKSLTYIYNRKTPCHVVNSLESMKNVEKLIVFLANDHLDKHMDLIILSIPYLQQLQSFRLDIPSTQHMMWFLNIHSAAENDIFTVSVLQSTRLFTELGKLKNLVSIALSCLDLTTVEKVEFPKNLSSVYLSNMIVSSDLFAHVPASCTEVHLECLNCSGDLVFPSTCTTLSCSKVSCTGDLVFPSTCTTLNCRNVSCSGDLVFPSTCATLNCSNIVCTGELMFPSTCTTLNCYNVSHTGDLVFPSTCTTLNCSGLSCTGKLVFPRVCTKLILALMSLPDLAVLPDSLTSLDMEDVIFTQAAAEEQLRRGLRSSSTLQRLSVCGGNGHDLYLHEHLDLSSYLSLHSLELGRILMDSCGVVVPHNVREIRMWGVTLSEEYCDKLVKNIYTCHNVRASLLGVTINEATLKYIRQNFIVTHVDLIPDNSDLTNEEETDITDEWNDRKDEKNDITDEKNDTKDEENDFTTVKRDIEFHTKCPENK